MSDQQIETVIELLQDVDGETMQYILNKVLMEEQMLRQLMLTMPLGDIEYLLDQRAIIEVYK